MGFGETLPRAGLYAQGNPERMIRRWQQLADPQVDTTQTVLVSEDIAGPPPDNQPPTATLRPKEFEANEYAPKQVVLRTDANVTSELLQTDKCDPDCKVTVNDQGASSGQEFPDARRGPAGG